GGGCGHIGGAIRAPPQTAHAPGRRGRDHRRAGGDRAHPQPRHVLPVPAGLGSSVPHRLSGTRRGAGAGARPQARRGAAVLPRARRRARGLGRPALRTGRCGERVRDGRCVSDHGPRR
ncbi:MAG: Xaa-Pro aminopeptidase, partial [uncultured Lysobacter sp.]